MDLSLSTLRAPCDNILSLMFSQCFVIPQSLGVSITTHAPVLFQAIPTIVYSVYIPFLFTQQLQDLSLASASKAASASITALTSNIETIY